MILGWHCGCRALSVRTDPISLSCHEGVKFPERAPWWQRLVYERMKSLHAFLFLLTGTGMLVSPAIWPEAFVADHELSASWLGWIGGLQAVGGAGWLSLEFLRWLRRASTWESFDFSLRLPDVRWAAPASLYVRMEESDEVAIALRLQQQLLQPVAA